MHAYMFRASEERDVTWSVVCEWVIACSLNVHFCTNGP